MRLVLASAHHAAVIDDVGQHDRHQSAALRGGRLHCHLSRGDQLDGHRGRSSKTESTGCAPPKRKEQQLLCVAKARFAASSIPAVHIREGDFAVQRPGRPVHPWLKPSMPPRPGAGWSARGPVFFPAFLGKGQYACHDILLSSRIRHMTNRLYVGLALDRKNRDVIQAKG